MASFPPSVTKTTAAYSSSFSTTTTFPNLITLSSGPFFSKKMSQVSIIRKRISRSKVSCKNIDGDQNARTTRNAETSLGKFDRRSVLFGFGGLYGAASTLVADPLAFAEPIITPDLSNCCDAHLPGKALPINCCPPMGKHGIVDFEPPPPSKPLRIRPAADLVDNDYINKYKRAVELMKAL